MELTKLLELKNQHDQKPITKAAQTGSEEYEKLNRGLEKIASGGWLHMHTGFQMSHSSSMMIKPLGT